MIQAGTISTGSRADLGGHRCVLNELDQLIAKHDFPRRGSEVFSDRETVCNAAERSGLVVQQVTQPRARLAPPLVRVASITSGLSQGTLDGEIRSSHWRMPKATCCSFRGWPPRWTAAALVHHSSPSRKAWESRLNGGLPAMPDG